MVLTGANNAGAVAVGAGAGAWMAKLDGLTLGNGLVWLARLSLTAMPGKWQRVTDEGPAQASETQCARRGVAHLALAQVHSWRARNKEETAKPPRVCYTPSTQNGVPWYQGNTSTVERNGPSVCDAQWAALVHPKLPGTKAGWLDPAVHVCLSVCLSACLSVSCYPVLHLAPNGGASVSTTHPSESENCLCLWGRSDDTY